ncbi:unnamed protein product [Euphydryas editha]|uniref:Regulatory protein zeste n=1 Tax=Euphydryas editha TaxID=104508 RepID=A0AAU9VFJ8_EUPED|nr:unnamed protein product [Euphydryas editha]
MINKIVGSLPASMACSHYVVKNNLKCKRRYYEARSLARSKEETVKLTFLLKDYSIITSKRTDHASNQKKDAAWRSLAEKINSDAVVYRNVKQLQKFNSVKNSQKSTVIIMLSLQEMSAEKNGRKQTGGGPPPPKPSETTEWLSTIMGESISRLTRYI